MKVDWTPQQTSNFGNAGVYRAVIEKAEMKIGRRHGTPYFSVVLLAEDFKDSMGAMKFLCYDAIVCEGDGRRIGQGKLAELGFAEEDGEIEPYQLQGRRVYAWISKEQTPGGKIRRKVDLLWEYGFKAGYCTATESPRPEWPMILPDAPNPIETPF